LFPLTSVLSQEGRGGKARTLKGAATTPREDLWFLLPLGEKARMRGDEVKDYPLTSVLSPMGRGGKVRTLKGAATFYIKNQIRVF
jgi:hypothetical protein